MVRAKRVFNLPEVREDGSKNVIVDCYALLQKMVKPPLVRGSHSLNIHTLFTRLRAHTHGAEDDCVAAAAVFFQTMLRLLDEATAVSVKRNAQEVK